MINLLICGHETAWKGEPVVFDKSRCINEFTAEGIKAIYGSLDQKTVEEIKAIPCIFAYEKPSMKNPKFGYITDVFTRGNDVKIEYSIIEVDDFFTASDFHSLSFELNMPDFEYYRTHWAIKDGDIDVLLKKKGKKVVSKPIIIDVEHHFFDVALSFPGEYRKYVEEVYNEFIQINGINTCFYDKTYQSQLARPSLDILLQDIYRRRSTLIVVFICADYDSKPWCGIEFRAIREFIMDKEYNHKIMFVKMDSSNVDGVFKVDGYIDANTYTAQETARLIKERLEVTKRKNSNS